MVVSQSLPSIRQTSAVPKNVSVFLDGFVFGLTVLPVTLITNFLPSEELGRNRRLAVLVAHKL